MQDYLLQKYVKYVHPWLGLRITWSYQSKIWLFGIKIPLKAWKIQWEDGEQDVETCSMFHYINMAKWPYSFQKCQNLAFL